MEQGDGQADLVLRTLGSSVALISCQCFRTFSVVTLVWPRVINLCSLFSSP